MIKRRLHEKEGAETLPTSNLSTTRGISATASRRRNIGGQFYLTTGRNIKSNKSGDLSATPKR